MPICFVDTTHSEGYSLKNSLLCHNIDFRNLEEMSISFVVQQNALITHVYSLHTRLLINVTDVRFLFDIERNCYPL